MARVLTQSANFSASLASTVISDFTIGCWVRRTTADAGATSYPFYNGVPASDGWGIQCQGSLVGGFYGGVLESIGSATLTANVWTHACLRRTVGGAARFFRNGVQQGAGDDNVTPNTPTTSVLSSIAGNHVIEIADAFILERALSNNEILGLGTGAQIRDVLGQLPKLYVPFWGIDSPEPDLSGNVYNATLSGSPAAANHAPTEPFTPRAIPIPSMQAEMRTGWRFRNDDGSETTATWQAAQNVAGFVPKSTAFRFREQVAQIGATVTEKRIIRYRKQGQTGWRRITV